MDGVRKLTEDCSKLQGFSLYHGIGGGTGSGLSSLLIERISEDYPKIPKIGFTVFPSSQKSVSSVDCYNIVMSTPYLMKNLSVDFQFGNDSIASICHRNLKNIDEPSHCDLNEILSQAFSFATLGIRRSELLNLNFDTFESNFVPYPTMNFLVCSLTPFISSKLSETDFYHHNSSIHMLTREVTCQESFLSDLNLQDGLYTTLGIYFKGDQYAFRDINPAYASAVCCRSSKLRFVDWSPGGRRVGYCHLPTTVLKDGILRRPQNSVFMIGNNTAIRIPLRKLHDGFEMMVKKKAFLHWYRREGMEEREILEASQPLKSYLDDMDEITTPYDEDCEDFGEEEEEEEFCEDDEI